MNARHRLSLVIIVSFALIGIGAAALPEDMHGNTPLAASPISTSGALLSGCIDPPGDIDYILFSAVGGRRYILQTSHLSTDMDSILFLFGTDGQTILAVDDDSGEGTASRIEWTCESSGTYFAMVRHARATSGTGCYELSVSAVQTDDHGDSAITASPIATDGTPIPGSIEVGGDVDLFFFSVEKGYDYVIETKNLSEGMDTIVELLDTDGRNSIAIDDDSGTGTASRIAWGALASGTYFISVRQPDEAETGGYDLTVTRLGYGDDHANEARKATPIPAEGGGVSGRIDVPGDIDLFSFSASEDGEYTLVTEPHDSAMDVVLTLYATDGTTVLAVDEALGQRAATIEWTAPASGSYYLSVQHARSDGTGGYTVRLGVILKLEAIGRFNSSGYALDLWVKDDLAYLIVGVKGLLVIDLSDPINPVEIGSHSTRGYAQAIALDGNKAYIADRGEGLLIIDLSDPENLLELGVLDTPGSAQDVAVSGHYAFVADVTGGLQVIDIANPSAPKNVGAWATRGFAEGITIVGSLALVATGDAGLEIIDISDPTRPAGLSEIDLPGDVTDTAAYGNAVYVAAGYRGIRVIDLSDPAHPIEVRTVTTDGEVVGLFQRGNFLYAADSNKGLAVYSLTDPAAPKLLAIFDTPGSAVNIFATEDMAYVADREEGLAIIRLHP